MDDNGPANDVLDAETVCHHRQISRPIAGEQGRKIPCVQRVVPAFGIVVAAGIGKTGPGAVSTLMNVKRKKTRIRSRQAADFSNHQCSVFAWDKPDSSAQIRICVPSIHTSNCCGVLIPCHVSSPHSNLCGGVRRVTLGCFSTHTASIVQSAMLALKI